MSNGTIWEPIRKFPGYELSRTELVRNIKTRRIVPQRIDPFDREHRRRVVLMRGAYPVEAFVQELVYSTFGG